MGHNVLMDFDVDREPIYIASDFYKHPYGGIARNVDVTREQFARFFGITLEEVDRIPFNCKWFDIMEPSSEILGYRHARYPRNFMKGGVIITFSIVIITHSHARINQLLKIAPYLWEGHDGRLQPTN